MQIKKVLAGMLAVCMISGSLAACSSKAQTPSGDKADTTKEVKLEGSLVAANPTTFSIFLNFNNMPYNPEWKVWQDVAKKTNISLKSVISQSNSSEKESFQLMVSSGKLADIIGYVDPSELEKLGRDGAMIPLNDLIKKNAPHIQAVLDKDAKFKQTATSLDGNIYQIPKNQELVTAEFWWIRQDWLKKLNLSTPKTVDELYKVLSAFRNNDPNGNGKKDEVPLFDRAGYKMPDEYLYLWDSSTGFYPRDGKMTFEPLEKNFKTGVNNITKWYKEGLIDPEIFTRGAKGRDILLSGNLGGMTHDWVSAGDYNNSLPATIPGFEMAAFAPPADQNGVVKERTERMPGVGWGISSQCKDPVTVIKFMDYLFTEEGRTLMNWGIKDETYTVNSDGSKKFTDTVLKSDQTPLGYLRSLGVQYRVGMEQDGKYEYAFMTPAGITASDLYNNHKEWFIKDMPPYADGALGLKYTPTDETEYKKIMGNIKPYVDEKFQSWMLGTSNFDADYTEFVAQLKSRGIDKAIEINQKAYNTYLGKK